MLNPQLPDIKQIEKRTLDELYSLTESVLHNIEHKILSYDEQLHQLTEQHNKILDEIQQINLFTDFDFNFTDLKETTKTICITGKTSDLPTLQQALQPHELTALNSKQFKTGKKIEWAILLIAHISVKETIEKTIRDKVTFLISPIIKEHQKRFQKISKKN